MLTARGSFSIGEIDGIIYVAGGYNTYHSRAFEAYDLVGDTWLWDPTRWLNFYLTSAASGVVNGILYTAGGSDNIKGRPWTRAYDPISDSWTSRADMPNPIQFPAYGVINGKLYLTAYQSGPTSSDPEGNFAYVYDPCSNTWEGFAQSTIARSGAASGVINGILYVAGGNVVGGGRTNALEAYDPVADTWTVLEPMSENKVNAAGAVLNGKFYVIGGYDGIALNTVEVYDPETDTWSLAPPMPTARMGMLALAKNGGIYVIGGGSHDGSTVTPLSTVEFFNPCADCSELYTQEEVDQLVGRQ
ncbi:Kelch repeat-containing protein, partial [Thermodesulfobacteriota bacterium]